MKITIKQNSKKYAGIFVKYPHQTLLVDWVEVKK